MTQFGFFDAPLALVDGERGQVTYRAHFAGAARAAAWFVALRAGVDWHARRRVMYEREVDVPRLTAHFAIADLGAATLPEGIDAEAAAALREVAREATRVVGAGFNSVGLNFYRDGNDSVAPHNDRLGDLVAGEPIALVSVGGTRRMMIRAKKPGEAAVPIDLEAGSLLVMSWSSQLHYTHGVAKTKRAVGERISVALRVRPEG
jgi:alkylated DNA repair dioxygenase AlkB